MTPLRKYFIKGLSIASTETPGSAASTYGAGDSAWQNVSARLLTAVNHGDKASPGQQPPSLPTHLS